MTHILGLYEQFVKAHPEAAVTLLARCRDLTDKYRPLSDLRNLNTRQASQLMGVSRKRVWELYQAGRLGACVDGKPRFSEQDCQDYQGRRLKPGRPRKSASSKPV